MRQLPILIVGYRRYENIMILINQLTKKSNVKVYLAMDGLREPDAGQRLEFLEGLVARFQEIPCPIEIWNREENLGPAVSVTTAIDWFFSQESRGIIFEDDLQIGPDTLSFLENGLDFYEDDCSVKMVSGSNYWPNLKLKSSNIWASYPITWGWATWKDRWDFLRQGFFEGKSLKSQPGSLAEKFFWYVGATKCLSGVQDAWDIPFATFFKSTGGLCILPPVNLVMNVGVDDFAGNTHKFEWPLFSKIRDMPSEFSFKKSEDLEINSNIDDIIQEDLYNISSRNVLSGLLFLSYFKIKILSKRNDCFLGLRINRVLIPR